MAGKQPMVMGGMSMGHCFFPLPFNNGSTDVLSCGKPTGRQGDGYNSGVHKCGKSFHPIGSAVGGSSNVRVNGRGMHRWPGDSVSCGDQAGNAPVNSIFVGG